jgi:hypothetical protein
MRIVNSLRRDAKWNKTYETGPTMIKVDLGDDSDSVKWDELYDTDDD